MYVTHLGGSTLDPELSHSGGLALFAIHTGRPQDSCLLYLHLLNLDIGDKSTNCTGIIKGDNLYK